MLEIMPQGKEREGKRRERETEKEKEKEREKQGNLMERRNAKG